MYTISRATLFSDLLSLYIAGDKVGFWCTFRFSFNPLVPELFGRAQKNLIFYRGIEHYRFIFFNSMLAGKTP